MKIQHVAQFSVIAELPRVMAAGNSDPQNNSVWKASLTKEGDGTRRYTVLLAALFGLSALYLLQSVSPLRLESDAVDYLRTAAAIADGRVLPKVPFPSGYPIIIATLDRLGLGSSSFFVLTNCLFLGIGLWATWWIYREHSLPVRLWIIVATLLVISVVKSVAAPLPEAAFFGVSLLALATASAALSARGPKQLALFVAALAAAAFAVSIRTVGVALIPPLLWAFLTALNDSRRAARSDRWPTAVTILLMLFLGVAVVVLLRTPTINHYLRHPSFWYLHGELSSPVAGRIYGILTGLGQLIVNLPLSRFHSVAPVFAGAGALALVLLVLARARPADVYLVDIYLTFYLAVLAFWPYDSPRLWMPIAPLVAAHVVSALYRARHIATVRILIPVYATWFAVTGMLALAYTTRISLSHENFARLYGTDGGMATAALQTLSPQQIHSYNAQADTLIDRYGGGGRGHFDGDSSRP